MLASSALRSPQSASLGAKLGAFMQQEKETRPGAEVVLRYALSLSAREPSANANLAGILYDRGEPEGAKKHWTAAVEYAPVASRAQRMPQRDRAAVHVDAPLVAPQRAHRLDRHHAERLVDLPEVDVPRLHPRHRQRLPRHRADDHVIELRERH